MAKQLLLNVLVDTLGPYVEGLAIENLKLGIWSGKLELSNLQLKSGVLDNFNLPVTVIHGSLKSLKLKIPWTHLESKPVRVMIDGIFLLAGPLDIQNLTQEDLKNRTHMDKKAKLEMAEISALASGADPDPVHQAEKASYIQQLTAKIIDNLEVTLTNVHIRYEDSITVRGTTLAAGITLDRITLTTTDSNWEEKFVSRVEKDKTLAPSIHKLGRMENLTAYWNTRADRLDELTPSEWENEMRALIYRTEREVEQQKVDGAGATPDPKKTEKPKSTMAKFFKSPAKKSIKPDSGASVEAAAAVEAETAAGGAGSSSANDSEAQTTMMYLIPPPNKLEVKIIHTDNPQGKTPKVDLSAELSSLRLDLDKVQYKQLMSVIQMFVELEKQKLMSLHRPKNRPNVAPRAWWKYAYRLVVGRQPSFAKAVDTLLLCGKHRSRYIKLVKKARSRVRNSIPIPRAGSPEEKLQKDEEKELNVIEDLLPLQTLIVFRQIAALELLKEEKAAASSKVASVISSVVGGGSGPSIFSRMFGSKSKSTEVTSPKSANSPPPALVDEEDEKLMEQFLSVKSESMATSEITMRMNLKGELAVSLFTEGLPMSRMELALTSDVEIKGDGTVTVLVSLYDFLVEDLCTSRAVLPYIMVSQSQALEILNSAEDGDSIRSRTVKGEGGVAQLVLVYEASATASNLRIHAAPVEIYWNEVCIQRILSMFCSSSADASNIISNPLVMKALSRIYADAAVAPTQVFNIDIHFDAPKIIIPEDSESMSGGCLILDMGILDVKGYVAPSGDVSFTFSLSSVNVGMPEEIKDRYKYTIADSLSPDSRKDAELELRKLYLVNPFNINVFLQNEDKSAADMTVHLDVTEIVAQLNARKIVRILRTVNIITRTVNGIFDEEQAEESSSSQTQSSVTNVDWGDTVRDNVNIMKAGDSVLKPKKQNTDVLFGMTLESPRISAELIISETHSVEFSVTSLVTQVIQRPHDLMIDFKLTSLSLDDSLRSEEQRSIIGTKQGKQSNSSSSSGSSGGGDDHLIQITIFTLFSRHSPLMERMQVGTDIQLKFSNIFFCADDLTLLRLCPLVNDIFVGLDQVAEEAEEYDRAKELKERAAERKKKELLAQQAKRLRARRNTRAGGQQGRGDSSGAHLKATDENAVVVFEPKSPQKQKPKISGPTGMQLSCALSRVSLIIMRTHEQVQSASVLKHQVDLQLAYSAELSGLGLVMMMNDSGMKFNVQLNSFSVTDRRPSSSSFVYRKMICRSTFASEFSSATATSSNTSVTESHEYGALTTIGGGDTRKQAKGFGKTSNTDADADNDNILSVVFIEEPKGQSTVDVKVREITTILTVDSVMDLVDVAMKNVDAVMKLVDACAVDKKSQAKAHTSATSPTSGASSGRTTEASDSHSESTPTSSPSKSEKMALSEDEPKSTRLALNLNVINPRLILLEDPTKEDARAIVVRSEICVTFSTETEDTKVMDQQERLNVALQGTEAFILIEGLSKGSPQQIIEPTAISAFLSRRMERGILLHCKIALVAQDIIAKLSLNDMQLANKMIKDITKAQENVSSNTSVAFEEANKRRQQQQQASKDKKESTSLTNSISMFEVNLELGNISILAINDSSNLYQPVLRFAMDSCSFDARGAAKGGDLSGDGSIIFGLDYFNNSNSTWEPVLEKCRPCVSVQYSFASGLSVYINHDRTFQFNISGNMAKQLSLFVGMIQRIGIDDDTHNAEKHAVTFYNELGVPLEISDNVTGNPLVYLLDANPVPLPINSENKSNRSCTYSASELPTSFNLRAMGSMEQERKPILGLPLNVSKPQPHYLRPVTSASSSGGGLSPMRAPRQSLPDIQTTEPIVEEVYENQRYNALVAKWKPTSSTGIMPDPHNFSDVNGQAARAPQDIQLPGDRWEWVQSEWSVDKHAVIGKEIDADGWEYATGFGAFSASKQRRIQQPFDVVRRRKWVRSRILKSTPKDSASRPLVLFWDVDIDSGGFRHIRIRSAMQLTNELPVPLEVMLYGFQSSTSDPGGSLENRQSDAVVLDPIGEGQTLSIPLIYSHASFICFRLKTDANPPLQWSSEFDCRIMTGGRGRSGSSELLKDIFCSNNYGNTNSLIDTQTAYFQGLFRFSDKALKMVVAPYAVIYNHLPCDYLFRTATTVPDPVRGRSSVHQNQNNARDIKGGEYGLVAGGSKTKLLLFDCKSPLRLQLQVGSYMWSSPVQISHQSKSNFTVDMLSPSDETGGMSVSVVADQVQHSNTAWKVLEVHVYCTYMLIDRSGLNVSVRTKRSAPPPSVNVGSRVSSGNDANEGVIHGSKLVERRSYGVQDVSDIKGSWIEGGNHVVLFQADDNNCMFGVKKGHSWSDSLSLQSIGSGKVQFEVIDQQACSAYQLAFSVSSLPGAFQATQVVTVVPCYTIVNTTGENIHIRQAESNSHTVDVLTVKSMAVKPWHRLDASAGTTLQLCSDSTDWSFGAIDINEIGSYTLILPAKEGKEDSELIVAHVEIKFSDPSDLSYVTMVIWRAEMDKQGFHNTAAICVQNDTDVPITILQDGIDFSMAGLNPRCFELCVKPGSNMAFGWIDPQGSTRIRAVVDTSISESVGQQALLDLAKVGVECSLEMVHYSVELDSVQLIVKAGAGGKILHVIRKSLWEAEEREMQLRKPEEYPEKDNKYVKVNFHSIGISVIAERPIRREMFGAFIDSIEMQWSETAHIAPVKGNSSPASTDASSSSNNDQAPGESQVIVVSTVQSSRTLRGKKTSLSVSIADLQVDNYSETMVYPVLIHSYHSSERKDAARKKAITNSSSRFKRKKSLSDAQEPEEPEDPLNFITFGLVSFVPQGSITPTFKYLALRVLEINVAVDTSTLQLYFLDLHYDLIGESVEQVLATVNPTKWINNFNLRMIVPDGTYPIANVNKALRNASVQRMYIEEFVLHPVKIKLSYTHTAFPRNSSEDIFSTPSYRWLKFVQGIAAVDDFAVKLKSFIVSDALETTNSLMDRVGHIYINDLKSHVVQIASQFLGSLRIIGKPVGLYRNIGAGVKDFYYEPYQGFIHSPESFMMGVGRGTGSLFKHFAAGVVGSTAAIVESATKGVAKGAVFLSGDAEFARQREEKRRQNASGGLLAGVKAGGESFVSGFASGISGLVTKPIEEGRKTGVTGFAKGLGLGAVGAIVKPVMGVTDGMAAVAHGLSNQMNVDAPQVPQIRPPRAMHRSTADVDEYILVPLNIMEAKAQAHALKHATKESKKDAFVGAVIISDMPGSSNNNASAQACVDVSSNNSNHGNSGNSSGRKGSNASNGQLVYLTENYLVLAQYNTQFDIVHVDLRLPYGDISHCTLQLDFLTVEVVIYKSSAGGAPPNSGGGTSLAPATAMGCSTFPINCSDAETALDLYALLYRMSSHMGSPSNMLPPETMMAASKPDINGSNNNSNSSSATTNPTNSSSSSISESTHSDNLSSNPSEIVTTSVDGYTFGSINYLKFGNVSSLPETEILSKCEERLRTVGKANNKVGDPDFDPQAYQRELDTKVWRLIYEWQGSHTTIRASRCLACLIINRSEHPVQLLRTEMMEGKNVKILGGTVDVGGYDHESRTLLGRGGAAVVFAYGFTPSLIDKGHAKVRVFTSAFSGQLSTRKAGTSCTPVGGYEVRFLEKSSSDWWSKYVILVS